jgi:hypothetical protein
MGGIGSGRRNQIGKETTRDMQPLDVRKLSRAGLLSPGKAFGWQWTEDDQQVASIQLRVAVDHVMLRYRARQNGLWQPMEYPVFLEWTSCNLGGQRAWFRCPAKGCGRRAAILYGGSIFACRQCHHLVYESQREADYDRAARRAETFRSRLQWEPGILNGNGAGKPKRMHWRTFARLQAEHNRMVNISLLGIKQRLIRVYAGVDGLAAVLGSLKS